MNLPLFFAVAGLLVLTLALVAVIWTGWLQSNTLRKCMLMSLVFHLLVGGGLVALGGLGIRSGGYSVGTGETPTVVLLVADEPELPTGGPGEPDEAVRGDEESPADGAKPEDVAEQAVPAVMPEALPAAEPVVAVDDASEPPPLLPEDMLVQADGPTATDTANASADLADDLASAVRAAQPAAGRQSASSSAQSGVPLDYGSRAGFRRREALLAWGGSDATEAAVAAALGWLAANQSADGRWDARRHGAGRVGAAGLAGHGPESGQASDHGLTGLALLAFLGAGHTPESGPYADVVDRGVRFLVEHQHADGSLAGPAAFFASLYCHGMAALAIAECYALTADPALRPVLKRAVAFTVSRQHPATGGWRYAARDRGDTSQLGWQLMVLASTRQVDLPAARQAEGASRRFLETVASGRHGGLAGYRPGERPTAAMTAEAVYARLLLGLSPESPTVAEAVAFLDASRPGQSVHDCYAWYYGTLALFHVGGPAWERWNGALTTTLLATQQTGRGPLVGSWDPDPVWGALGGRVYATALPTLMLEVYYRYQPLHRQQPRQQSVGTAAATVAGGRAGLR